MNDHRLRQGHHEPRNLWQYRADEPPKSKSGECVGQVFDAELAEEIVTAVNALRAIGPDGGDPEQLIAAWHADRATHRTRARELAGEDQ